MKTFILFLIIAAASFYGYTKTEWYTCSQLSKLPFTLNMNDEIIKLQMREYCIREVGYTF